MDALSLALFVAAVSLAVAVGILGLRARRLAAAGAVLSRELAGAHARIAEGERALATERAAGARLEDELSASRARFAEILAAVPAAVVTYDAGGVCASADGAAVATLFGPTPLVGRTVEDVHPSAAASVRRALAGERLTSVEVVGGRRVETAYAPAGAGAVAVSLDLRERDRVERSWRLAEERALRLFEEAPFGAALVGPDGRIFRANRALSETLGFTTAELAVLRLDELVHPEDAGAGERERERLTRGEIESYRVEQRLRRKDGEAPTLAATVVALRDAERRLTGRLVMVRDLSGRRHDEELAEHFARRDALTGLPNRLAFEERLVELVGRLRREKERMGLVVFDVDNAAAIAERLGSRGRDATLRALATRLQESVADLETLARVGSSTFAFTLARRGAAGTAEVVEKLLGAIADGVSFDGQRAHADLRLGFAMYPEDASEAEDLLRRADAALAHAKRAGRRYTRYAENVAV